jgi:putative spermidine/putrescine transport system permease protein
VRDWLASRSFDFVFGVVGVLAILLLTLPAVVVVIMSFTDAHTLRFPPPAYSLRWYSALLESEDILGAAVKSFWIATAATGAAVAFGVPAALYLARSRSKTARALDNFFMAPLILPALAFGLALVVLITNAGFPLSIYTLIIGHVVVCVPLVLRTTLASLARLDTAALESSESLGASRLYTFRRVTLPSIRTGILAGAFIAFLSSFDNIPVSLFLSDARTVVLPIRMWQLIENNLDVRVASVSGVILIVTIVLVAVMDRLVGLNRHLR